jgi:hypothetical protein
VPLQLRNGDPRRALGTGQAAEHQGTVKATYDPTAELSPGICVCACVFAPGGTAGKTMLRRIVHRSERKTQFMRAFVLTCPPQSRGNASNSRQRCALGLLHIWGSMFLLIFT